MFSPILFYTISIITLFHIEIEKTEGYFLLENSIMSSSDIEAATKSILQSLDGKPLSVHNLSARGYIQKLPFMKTITKNPSSTTEMKRVSSSSTTGSTNDPSLTTKADKEIDITSFDSNDLANVKSNSNSDRQTFTGTLSHLSATDDAQNKILLSSSIKPLYTNWKNPSTLSKLIHSSTTTDDESKDLRLKFKKKRYEPSESGISPAEDNSIPTVSKQFMRYMAKTDKKSTVNKVTTTMVSNRDRINDVVTIATLTFKRPSVTVTTRLPKPTPNFSWKKFVPIRSCGGFIGTAPPKLDRNSHVTKLSQ